MNKKLNLAILGLLLVFGISYLVSQNRNEEPLPQTSTNDDPTTNSKTVDLSGRQLTTIPESVLSQPAIKSLNISNNQLVTLPAGITKLVNLEILNVENNRLETFPGELSSMTNLHEIRANNNRMKSIPDNMSTMTWLRYLDVSGNDIPANEVDRLREKLPNAQIKS